MILGNRITDRIAKEFPSSEQAAVAELLESYPESGEERVRWDILELSKGDLEKVRQYVKAAQTDPRDVMYWAEYYDTDPLLQGKDPKKIVEDIIEKWGDKK
jgi:hypothetical protein